MLREIINLQNWAVKKILDISERKKEITLKSPTGSGKTIIIANLINKILENDEETIFLVSSLSKGELALQNYEKFLENEQSFPFIKPYLINTELTTEEKLSIPMDYNVYNLPRDLYKQNSKLMQGGLIIFLNRVKSLKKKVWLIKDECHIATNNLDTLKEYFFKILNVSATPQTNKFTIDVEINNSKAENLNLIKHINLMGEGDFQEFENALLHFKKIKNEYNSFLNINPCMIVQISNKNKGSYEWNKLKEQICNYPELHWMYITGNVNEFETNDDIGKIEKNQWKTKWKKYAKLNSSLIDIIIFKMVISEGWDIPRACCLFQLRDSESEILNEQIIGRIRRNPIIKVWEEYNHLPDLQKSVLQAYVWGKVEEKFRSFKRISIKEKLNFFIQTTKLESLDSLYEKMHFNYINWVKENSKFLINKDNIFNLFKNWNNITEDTKNLCWNNIKTPKEWVIISNLIKKLDYENNKIISDYANSMIINNQKVNFSSESYFEIVGKHLEIEDWVWTLEQFQDNEYYFDSDAERSFAKLLKSLKLTTWGKNFYPNSKIYFEYINFTKSKSYPDFILQDKNNLIHIFEVKSFNGDNGSLNEDDYTAKLFNLKKCYLNASKITKNIFYIPIYNPNQTNQWHIYKFENGKEYQIDENNLLYSLH